MKTQNGKMIIESVVRFNPNAEWLSFTDESETQFWISIKDVIRLYEGTKFNMEKSGIDWEKFCDKLFKPEN